MVDHIHTERDDTSDTWAPLLGSGSRAGDDKVDEGLMTVMSSLYLSLRTVSTPATRAVYTLAGIEVVGAGMTDESDHFTLSS